MAEIIRLFQVNSFDPEMVKAICDAYDGAIQELRGRGRVDGLEDYLAGHIISLAKQGERNPVRLRSGALKALDSSMCAEQVEPHPTDVEYLRRVFASVRQSASKIEQATALVAESQALLDRAERQLDRAVFVSDH